MFDFEVHGSAIGDLLIAKLIQEVLRVHLETSQSTILVREYKVYRVDLIVYEGLVFQLSHCKLAFLEAPSRLSEVSFRD